MALPLLQSPRRTVIPLPGKHMPSSHRRHAGWTIERIRHDATVIGRAHPPVRSREPKRLADPDLGIATISVGAGH
jgi:hypothetical protein